MTAHRFLVFSEAQPGRDAEFNDWFDNHQLPDVLKVPGFIGGQRFRLQPEGDGVDGVTRYLTIYEIETNDLPATIADLHSRANTPDMPLSDALNLSTLKTYIADQLGDRIAARPRAD